jgi:uncharacterized protein YutE (UPF0331/DUF86 family)
MELLEKLKSLEENVKILKEIRNSVTKEELKLNKRYEWEIRYGLFESIQIVIDISCKISSTYNLGNPKSYKECVELLAKHKYISQKMLPKLVSMIGLRNLLVHEYVEIDNDKLYQFLDFLGDFISFVDEIKDTNI